MKNSHSIQKKLFFKPVLLYFPLFPFSIFLLSSCNKSPTESEDKRPQINVQSPITQNTTWESGNDYIIRGTVTVEENAMLTINRDVNVYFTFDSLGNKGKLEVLGGIYADGVDTTGMIFFGNYDNDQSNFSRFEIRNTTLNVGFHFCVFDEMLYVFNIINSQLIITKCVFDNCGRSLNLNRCANIKIDESIFENNRIPIILELSGYPVDSLNIISNNEFINCEQKAIELKNYSGAYIYGNNFNNCEIGVDGYYYTDIHLILNNFYNCGVCCKYFSDSSGKILNNTFSECDDFIHIRKLSYPKINHNNFLNCMNYKIRLDSFTYLSIDAKNNWWNTVNVSEIELYIFDKNDVTNDETISVVEYNPFESSYIIN